MLHVFDISVNNFTGKLPLEYICHWKSMVVTDVPPQLAGYVSLQNVSAGYQDTLEIVSKGIYLEMEKIFNTFTSINLSHNKFRGNISAALIGELKALMGLNLSANDLIGQIPASFTQLIRLESLDLSSNNLSGEIPQQMASTLTSLSFLNLSQNHLTGMIPQGSQFATFSNASYEGNVGLCGFPLSKRCGSEVERALPPAASTRLEEEEEEDFTIIGLLDWRFVIAGYCSGMIIGVVIGHTMFWRIIGCFKLTSRMERFKPKRKSSKRRRSKAMGE
ncbi:receptor like protein 26-like [Telopea speciosissima]|uniref:receptor like protein 26-like n=1 Tax=Telopea speciosissima TaxID=54955 RepID=UPI001CC545BC|nr:receptor like protein 26-like [Telopea speciosissima]